MVWQNDLLSNFSTICRTSTEFGYVVGAVCIHNPISYLNSYKLMSFKENFPFIFQYTHTYNIRTPIYIFHHANHVCTCHVCVSTENHQRSTIDELLIRLYVDVDYDNTRPIQWFSSVFHLLLLLLKFASHTLKIYHLFI